MTFTFTLRQANKLVDKINVRLGTLDISPTQNVNIWEVTDSQTTFQELQHIYHTNIKRYLNLIAIRQSIRDQIGDRNQVQVNDLVAQRKALLDQLGMYRSIISQINEHAVQSANALHSKVEAAKASGDQYGRDMICVSVLSDNSVEGMDKIVNQLQRQVEAIEDQLTTANSNSATLVILQQDQYADLRMEGIIQ